MGELDTQTSCNRIKSVESPKQKSINTHISLTNFRPSFSRTQLSDILLSLSIITLDRNIFMSAERKIFISAATYGILGLAAGFFGRTYTHSMGMEDSSHLSVLHTHILALGFFFFLIALALEKLYTLSSQKKLFSAFFWAYSVGLVMTVVSMFAIGIIQANGGEESKALVVFLVSDTF